MNAFRFNDWAMPVVNRRWAVVAVLADGFKRATHYKVGVRFAHRSWEKAVGVTA